LKRIEGPLEEMRVDSAWKPFHRMAMVSAPWPLFNRPSIQLGTLKAYLESRFPGFRVDSHHLYLKIADTLGFELYQAISERSWLAESVYAALLFPQRHHSAERLFIRESRGKSIFRGVCFDALVERVRAATQTFIEEIEWEACGLTGFSVCLCQLTASLYLIRQIKELHPGARIVTGGSSWIVDSSPAWFRHFPEIDYIIVGEGELPLAELVCHLQSPPEKRQPLQADSIAFPSRPASEKEGPSFCQLEALDGLPLPDYDDYFSALEDLPPGHSFFPTLPVEISRGCWWRRFDSRGGSGCAFCNLNLQWKGYRSKRPEKTAAEIDALTSRYRTLSVAITDNALPKKDIPKIFGGLASLGKDLRLFGEIRATIDRDALDIMKRAGVEELQVGIEALSSRLLAKMNKGTTCIQNLQTMKDCEELSIINSSNLIMQFPGSDEEDVRETLQALDFAQVYRPLKPVRFWLGLESPVYRSFRSGGNRRVSNHPHYASIFPQKILRDVRLMIQGYRGDLMAQRRLWRPVVERLKTWERAYEGVRNSSGGDPALSYRDGRDFLIIHQRRPWLASIHHRVTGSSRGIYLFCRSHRSLREVLGQFPNLPEDKVRSFLNSMVEKKLMFREGDRFLSLAVALSRHATRC
jgi:ribosomal peptide maturation radical SAM protein 1